MSVATHIETLQQKHALLKKMVEQESQRPSPDFMRINHLKKQKLIIKEEIYSLADKVGLSQASAS